MFDSRTMADRGRGFTEKWEPGSDVEASLDVEVGWDQRDAILPTILIEARSPEGYTLIGMSPSQALEAGMALVKAAHILQHEMTAHDIR